MPDLFVFCLLLSAPLPSAAPPDTPAAVCTTSRRYIVFCLLLSAPLPSAAPPDTTARLLLSAPLPSAAPPDMTACLVQFCPQPRYGIFESRIMDEHIQALLSKQWIQQQTVDSTVEPRCLGFYDCPGP